MVFTFKYCKNYLISQKLHTLKNTFHIRILYGLYLLLHEKSCLFKAVYNRFHVKKTKNNLYYSIDN